MNPSTSLGTRSNVGMAKPSPPVRQAGNIGRLLVIHGVCRRSVPRACPQVKYRCRCRDNSLSDNDLPERKCERQNNARILLANSKSLSFSTLIFGKAQERLG